MGIIEDFINKLNQGIRNITDDKPLGNYLNEIIKKEKIDATLSFFNIQSDCTHILIELQQRGKLTERIIIEIIKKGYKIREETPDIIKKNIKYILLAIEEKDYQVIDYTSDEIIDRIPKEITDELLEHYEIKPQKGISKPLSKNLKYVLKMLEQEGLHGEYYILDYIDDKILDQIPKEYIINTLTNDYIISERTSKRILEDRELLNEIINKALKNKEYDKIKAILQYGLYFLKEDIENIHKYIEELYKTKKISQYDRNYIFSSACDNKYFYNNPIFIKMFIDYGLVDIIHNISEDIMKKLNVDGIDYIQKAIEKGYSIREDTPNYIKINKEYVLTYILKFDVKKDISKYYELLDIILEAIPQKTISEILNDRQLLENLTLEELKKLFFLAKDNNETLLEILSKKNNMNKEKLIEKLKYLYSKNEFIYQEIDLEILDNEFDFIDIEVLNRIIPDNSITQLLIKYKNDTRWNTTKKILKISLDYIKNIYGQNTNYDEIIYKIITQGLSTNNFDTLFKNIKVLDKQQTKLLIKLLLNKENVYNITTPDELKKENFEIIMRNYFEKIEDRIKETNDISYVRYQILYKIYNITKEDADLIFKRYCYDLDNQTQINSIVKNINYIMKCENIEELKEIYLKIKNPQFNYDKFIMYENDIRNEYIKEFNRTLYVPRQEDLIEMIEYGNEKIHVYEINSDFNMIIHVYNAIEQDNLEWWESVKSNSSIAQYEDWNTNSMSNHGICCSFIGQNLLALASNKNPKFGFINLERDSIIHMHFDDLFTSNTAFGETYVDISNDHFYSPKGLITNTALKSVELYNEIVLERKLLKTKAQQYKRNPDYILYLYDEETKEEIPTNLIRAAINFKIPIIKVNMQKTIEREIKKIDDMILDLQKTKNQKLIHEIILQIYCNLASSEKNEPLKKYKKILKEKLNQLIIYIEKNINDEKIRPFALKVYKEILELQIKYTILDEKIMDELNAAFSDNHNIEISKTK